MPITIERGKTSQGIQTLRMRADVIDRCNLACSYCSANQGWTRDELSAKQIFEIFSAAEKNGFLEVTMSGGEITLHKSLRKILQATHVLDKTLATLVTNATRITPEVVKEIRDSNIARVTVSIDGPDGQTHNSMRGKNFDVVMRGLKDLQQTSKRINVASVAHAGNYDRLIELSELLAKNQLACEHSICAVFSSGVAKDAYDTMRLTEEQFYRIQHDVDVVKGDLSKQGLNLYFSNFWMATGKRGETADRRSMFLAQWCEQVKNLFMIVQPNGDVRISATAWGRETVGNQVVGNLKNKDIQVLLDRVDEIYASGRVIQLPREVEAGYKLHVGPQSVSEEKTKELVDVYDTDVKKEVELVPVIQLSQHEILNEPFEDELIETMAIQVAYEPERWRLIHHRSGVDIVFDKKTQHMTVLASGETQKLIQIVNNMPNPSETNTNI